MIHLLARRYVRVHVVVGACDGYYPLPSLPSLAFFRFSSLPATQSGVSWREEGRGKRILHGSQASERPHYGLYYWSLVQLCVLKLGSEFQELEGNH